MIIYLSGPIRKNPDYKNQFAAAEKRILDANAGRRVQNEVINPAEFRYPVSLADGREKENAIMAVCKCYLDMADAIYMLRGWEDSPGAKSELAYFIREHGSIAEVYTEDGTGAKYAWLYGQNRTE